MERGYSDAPSERRKSEYKKKIREVNQEFNEAYLPPGTPRNQRFDEPLLPPRNWGYKLGSLVFWGLQACFGWLIGFTTYWTVTKLVIFVPALIFWVSIPSHRPEDESTMNSATAANMKLDEAPVGYYTAGGIHVFDPLSPRYSELAHTASVLRSYCAVASDRLSPHIGDEYRDVSRSIGLVLGSGQEYTRRLLDARHEEEASLRTIYRDARRMHEVYRAGVSRWRRLRCWILRMHECAHHSTPAAVDDMLSLKRSLAALASGDPFSQGWEGRPGDDIAADLERIAVRLKAADDAVAGFAKVSPALGLKNRARRTCEFVFRHVPKVGPIIRYLTPDFWSWVSGSEEMASAFLARAIMGHTHAAYQDVLQASNQYSQWVSYVAGTKNTWVIDLEGIGVEGQELAEAARRIAEAAGKLLLRHQRDTDWMSRVLRALFGVGAE
ncbi:hypothetical protein F5Y01DRAFT_319795 [Xylaria sp. FL0043]|nr:hypothetical protein F5Y01DRAFT_319795 [Xylaria sp. FL0043]